MSKASMSGAGSDGSTAGVIRVAISTDARGFPPNATLIASILRRTEARVEVRCWCRGFLPESFEVGRLRVEFLAAEGEVSGHFPGHVNEAVYDRLRVIRDCADWDRCLIMDHDMGVFCDLAPYFAEDFEGKLLMGRLFGPGNTLGLQIGRRGGLPPGYEHCAEYPYFFMGPMLNLALMREERTWEKFVAAHTALGEDEQMSLTAACGGRVKGVDKRYNLVPQWDDLEAEGQAALASGQAEWESRGVQWRRGVPVGLIHWTGWDKPWRRGTKVWRADLWEGERTNWEELRLGLWEKLLAVVVEPENGFGVRALARRGWRVRVFGKRFAGVELPHLDEREAAFPDVWAEGGENGAWAEALAQVPEVVRFGAGAPVARWVQREAVRPRWLAVAGPLGAAVVEELRALGYRREWRYAKHAWPTGGVAPRVLAELAGGESGGSATVALGADEEWYGELVADATDGVGGLSGLATGGVEPSRAEAQEATNEGAESDFLAEELGEFLASVEAEQKEAAVVWQLGAGPTTAVLARTFPGNRVKVLEFDPRRHGDCTRELGERVDLRFVPLCAEARWFDWSRAGLAGEVDWLVVSLEAGPRNEEVVKGAVALRRMLAVGGRVVLMGETGREVVSAWLECGGVEVLRQEFWGAVLEVVAKAEFSPAFAKGADLRSMAEKVYVISLPERVDRRRELEENWRGLGLTYEWVDGVRVSADEISWREMRGMEAYGRAEMLRGDYVCGAVGCKRAGIAALERFLASGAETALICQDDCRWREGAEEMVRQGLAEVPEDWEVVYFSASARTPGELVSPRMLRLQGARLCTAILWRRAAAERILAGLRECDCEWDVFMERSHPQMAAYCVVPMPAYQARSRSDIVRAVVQPGNR